LFRNGQGFAPAMDESSEADSGTADHQPLEPQATYA
jgi:hypothetical protein